MLDSIKDDLHHYAKPEKVDDLSRFFKTGPGDYGEGDKFLGVMVPDNRKVVSRYWREATLENVTALLHSCWHEERLLALLILVKKFSNGSDKTRKLIFDFYIKNTKFINNWDLVDLSCYKIIGIYLYEHPEKRPIFNELASSELLWNRRIAVVSSYYFIQHGDPSITFSLVCKLLGDSSDLIQKANGWMLREVGKRVDADLLLSFIKDNYDNMPRTTLRYAIEKFSPDVRKRILSNQFDGLILMESV